MLKETDLAWLGGIIDGEGTLALIRCNGVNREACSFPIRFVTKCAIFNTDMEMIKKCSVIFSELNIKYYYTLKNPSKKFPNGKKGLTINIEGYTSVKQLLDAVKPFVISGQKSREINILLEYIDFRKAYHGMGSNQGLSIEKKKELHELNLDFKARLDKCKKYQVSPPTTKRVASTPLKW